MVLKYIPNTTQADWQTKRLYTIAQNKYRKENYSQVVALYSTSLATHWDYSYSSACGSHVSPVLFQLNNTHTHTHTHNRFGQDKTDEPVPEETFTHSITPIVVISHPLSASAPSRITINTTSHTAILSCQTEMNHWLTAVVIPAAAATVPCLKLNHTYQQCTSLYNALWQTHNHFNELAGYH